MNNSKKLILKIVAFTIVGCVLFNSLSAARRAEIEREKFKRELEAGDKFKRELEEATQASLAESNARKKAEEQEQRELEAATRESLADKEAKEQEQRDLDAGIAASLAESKAAAKKARKKRASKVLHKKSESEPKVGGKISYEDFKEVFKNQGLYGASSFDDFKPGEIVIVCEELPYIPSYVKTDTDSEYLNSQRAHQEYISYLESVHKKGLIYGRFVPQSAQYGPSYLPIECKNGEIKWFKVSNVFKCPGAESGDEE